MVYRSRDINPVIPVDCPDVDVIRVGDTYYMVATTLYFMPGCEILQSKDLLHWKHAAYVYERLDSTDAQRMCEGSNIYGQGMWAASLRWHAGRFYVCFVANDTHKTYLYTADRINGPWEKHQIRGFYHDCSLLFDDDGRVYIAYGNTQIHITELDAELTGPKEGGLDRIVVNDIGNPYLGYEGTHFYKINGKYYLFFIHSRRDEWRRTEACFVSDSLDGTFVGGEVFDDDMGYCNQGIAQGGIVDTPSGKWYAFLFQDKGASGRMPVIIPVEWKDGFPMLGDNGKMPQYIEIEADETLNFPDTLVGSDDFKDGWSAKWQYNHEPKASCVKWDCGERAVTIETEQLSVNPVQARNMLTMRTVYPECEASVLADAKDLKDGDIIGMCALQGDYGMIALTREQDDMYLVLLERCPQEIGEPLVHVDMRKPAVLEKIPWDSTCARLRIVFEFEMMRDQATFYYEKEGQWHILGSPHHLHFEMDHFTGCRVGLAVYSTKEAGGSGRFLDYQFHGGADKKQALNPYLPSWEYIPDGEPYVFGDRVYVYGSHDLYNGYVFCMGDYVCYSAPVNDLGRWRYEGVIYKKEQDPINRDGRMCLYAPDVTVGPDGRYYLYYVLDKICIVSVAVADTPVGPFEFYGYVHYEDGTRLGERDGDEPQFDPGVYTEDGRTYLYTGFCPKGDKSRTGAMVTVLGEDMLTVVEAPVFIVPGFENGTGTEFEGHAFFEAPSIRKIGDIYYFIYSSEVMHELCYATSTCPTKDFTYRGVLVSNCDIGIDKDKPRNLPVAYGGNNHGSVIEIAGEWYIFYHRQTNGTWYSRQGCAEHLTLLADGSFPQVEMTSCGLNGGPLAGRGEYPAYLACNLFTGEPEVYAGRADLPKVMQDGRDGDEEIGYVTNLTNGATAGFKYFDCHEVKKIRITTRGYADGVFELRLTREGAVAATIPVVSSNGWEYVEADADVPDGVHAVYLTFRGTGAATLKSFEFLCIGK